MIAAMTVLVCSADTKGTPEDEQAIRKMVSAATADFNSHTYNQANATDDFDIVIPPGAYMTAKSNLRGVVEKDFQSGVFKNAQMVSTVDRIRFIRPDVAIVDGTFAISGSGIKPDPKGLDTLIVVKDNGNWKATALRRMVPVAAPGVARNAKP